MEKRISIITINYNNAAGLMQTIESVVTQNYQYLEYIVIDGGSSDDSVNIIKSFEENIHIWCSESDSGIYSAMNKGIARATGDYLLFLNSGDYLVDSTTISNHIEKFNDSGFVVFDAIFMIPGKGEYRRKHPDQLSFSFLYNDTFAHQAVFTQRKLFEKVGYYDESYKIVADWKFIIDAIVRYRASYKRIPEVLSYCILDGVSATGKGTDIRKKERRQILEIEYQVFREDYKKIAYFKLNRFKALAALEDNMFCKKLNSMWLKFMLYIIKRKRTNQL